jgi:hypothetical protein
MTVTGLVMSARRTRTREGSQYVRVVISPHDSPPGHTVALRYLAGIYSGHAPMRGDTVTIDGTPLVGHKRVNIGGVTVRKM